METGTSYWHLLGSASTFFDNMFYNFGSSQLVGSRYDNHDSEGWDQDMTSWFFIGKIMQLFIVKIILTHIRIFTLPIKVSCWGL